MENFVDQVDFLVMLVAGAFSVGVSFMVVGALFRLGWNLAPYIAAIAALAYFFSGY